MWIIPWLTSAGTLLAMWLAGSNDRRAWVVGLANQALWFALIFTTGTYGLLPLTVSLCVIYTRNLIRWEKVNKAVTQAIPNYCPDCGHPWAEHTNTGCNFEWGRGAMCDCTREGIGGSF